MNLPVIETSELTDRHISSTPEIDALLADDAPVAIGVSGGKDSCAVAIAYVRYLRSIGHKGRVILIHSDLGRVEWDDSLQTRRRLAEFLGAELVVVSRESGDMMDRWLTRWKNNVARYVNLQCVKVILPWSTPKMRFCTSEMKTAIICRELIRQFPGQRIISVSGVRRSESASRAKAPICKPQPKMSSRKHKTSGVDINAIATWSLSDVFHYCDEAGFTLHEAYRVHGSSRVSCRFCIMGSEADISKSAAVPAHIPLHREMVDLEIASTFAFQGDKWLGDVRPANLTEQQLSGVADAKQRAKERERIEAVIPKHLLYSKGWPTCMPTFAEANLLADVRNQIGQLMGLDVQYATGPAIMARYAELMQINASRSARKAA